MLLQRPCNNAPSSRWGSAEGPVWRTVTICDNQESRRPEPGV
jgi:hypothetical protein